MMDEPGSFYICTETSPRCYIIQKVSAKHVDQVMNELFVAEERWMEGENHGECRSATPPPPILPWWFTPECERQLETGCDSGIVQSTDEESSGRLGVDESDGDGGVALTPSPEFVVTSTDGQQSLMSIDIPIDGFGMDVTDELGHYTGFLANGSASFVQTPMMGSPRSPEELKLQLRQQLEYYFSRENLATDRYLRSQMDNDQYVPIRIIATFPKVMRLTSDLKLIVQVLRESANVQVDERGDRVRPICKRCTIILREIPESTERADIEALFKGGQCPPYLSLDYGLNNSWYVTFESEEATQKAFLHLQTEVKTFKDRPICARIKTGNAPQGAPSPQTTANEEPFGRMNGFRQMPPPTSLTIGSDKSPYSLASPDDSNMMTAASGTDGAATSMSFVNVASNIANGYHSVSPMGTMGRPMVVTYPPATMMAHSPSNSIGFDLGHILASYGYVPRATYRPDATVVHVAPSTMAMSLAAAAAAGHSPHYNQAHTSTQPSLNYRTRASSSLSHYGAEAHHHMGGRGPSPHPTGGRYRGGGGGRGARGGGGGSYYQHGGHATYGAYDRTAGRGRGRGAYAGRPTLHVRSRTPPADDAADNHQPQHRQHALAVNRGGGRPNVGRDGDREMRQRSASDFQSHYDKIRPRGAGGRRPIFLGAKDSSSFHYNSYHDYGHGRGRGGQSGKEGRASISPAISSAEDDINGKDVEMAPHGSIAKSDSMLEKASVYNFDPSSFPSLPNAKPDDAPAELDASEQQQPKKAGDEVVVKKESAPAPVRVEKSPPPPVVNVAVSSNETSAPRTKTPPAPTTASVPAARKPALSFSSVAAGTASAKGMDGRVAAVEAVEPVAASSTSSPTQEEETSPSSPDAPKRISYAQMAKTHKSTMNSTRSAPSPEAVSPTTESVAKEPPVSRVMPRKRWPAPTC